MNKRDEEALKSGAAHVEEMEDLASGYSTTREISEGPVETGESFGEFTSELTLSNLKLSMFFQDGVVLVRIGNIHDVSRFYDSSYPSVEEANDAMLRSGILQTERVPNLGAIASIEVILGDITEGQLAAGGLKRRSISTL